MPVVIACGHSLTLCRTRRRFNENLSKKKILNVSAPFNRKKPGARSRRSVKKPIDSANEIVQLLPTTPRR